MTFSTSYAIKIDIGATPNGGVVGARSGSHRQHRSEKGIAAADRVVDACTAPEKSVLVARRVAAARKNSKESVDGLYARSVIAAS
jgi:hypothetical protein